MKKKIIFAVATGLFTVATMFNMNMLQSNNASDVSLDAIAVMAQANNGENNGDDSATQCGYRSENWVEIMGQQVKVCVSGGKGNIECCK